jgi:hypothetical protein
MLGYTILLALEDEKWARSEARKTFNWNSLIDEIVVGFIAGLGLGYLDYLKSGAVSFNFPVVSVVTTMVIAGILGLIVEVLRPFHPQSGRLIAEDTTSLQKELENRIKSGEPLFYWESQNPLWGRATILAYTVLILTMVGFMWWFFNPVQALIALISTIIAPFLISIFSGGMRTTITRKDITIRDNILGLRLLRLRIAEISDIDLTDFKPQTFNRQAYFVNGKLNGSVIKGVALTLANGNKFFLGSHHPEQLFMVIKTISDNDKQFQHISN